MQSFGMMAAINYYCELTDSCNTSFDMMREDLPTENKKHYTKMIVELIKDSCRTELGSINRLDLF